MDPVIILWREGGKQINQIIEIHDRMEIKKMLYIFPRR